MMDFVKENLKAVLWGLVALLVLTSIWGSISSRTAKSLQLELDELKAGVVASEAGQQEAKKALEVHTSEANARVAELESQAKEFENKLKNKAVLMDQLKKARKELVELRKGNKKLEAQIVQYQNDLTGLKKSVATKKEQVGALSGDAKETKKQLALTQKKLDEVSAQYKDVSAKADKLTSVNVDMNKKLEVSLAEASQAKEKQAELAAMAEEIAIKFQENEEMTSAQVLGYEKMFEEKSLALEEISQELDRVKVNNEVLLGKISSQRDLLQELYQEREELVKSLAEKNKMLADFQGQTEESTVQE